MYDLIIRDATVIRSTGRQVADIGVEGGRVAYIGGNPAGGAREEVPGIGRFVVPGVIDTQVRFRGARGWAEGSRAAASAGVTTVVDLPDPDVVTVDRLRQRLGAAAGASTVNYGAWIAATPSNGDEVRAAWDDGIACAPLACLGAPEGRLALTLDGLREVFARAPGLLGVQAEDPAILAERRARWEGVADPVHNDLRPPVAAVEAVRVLVDLVKARRRPVHVCGLSTAGELNLLDPYRGDLPISISVAPFHLFLSVETAGKAAARFKVDPPVRPELDRRALWAAVKRGRIDTFASAHTAIALKEKARPYWSAPPGIPGVDTMYLLLMGAVKHGRMGLERLVEMCCEAPARLFGFAGKGSIHEGADADLIVFSEGATSRLNKVPPYSGCDWSPYLGRDVGAYPNLVVIGGRIVARDGVLTDAPPAGRPVTCAR